MGAHVSACTSWLGRGAAMAASPLDHNSTTTPYFYDVPGLFCQITSCGAPYSYPFWLPFHCQQMILPGSMFQTSISSTQPSSTTGDTVVQAGVLRALAQCVQFLHCSAFYKPSTAFSFDPPKFSFCSSWFPHCGVGRTSVCRTFSHFQLSSSVARLCCDSSFLFFLSFSFLFFFPFFHPIQLQGDFSFLGAQHTTKS